LDNIPHQSSLKILSRFETSFKFELLRKFAFGAEIFVGVHHGNSDDVPICTKSNKWQLSKHRWKPSRWWPSGKSLGLRGLLPLRSQVRTLWSLIWWPLEAYMVVNFMARGISRDTRKLARTPTIIKKKKKK